MSTMRDVAQRAKVSLATVSHVINGTRYVSADLTARVLQAMQELSYRPNRIARSLRTRRSHTIALIVSDITNPFFAHVVRGAEDAASARGFSVVVSNTDEDEQKEAEAIRVVIEYQHDGVIIASTGQHHREFQRLQQANVPLVLLDRRVPSIRADHILSNNEQAAYEATQYLIERGHRRIGLILGRQGIATSEERHQGFRRALQENEIPPSPTLEVRGDYRIDGGRRACLELLKQKPRPTALFPVNNRMTIGVLQALAEAEVRCPDDVSVMGFDDFDMLSIVTPPITTVAQQSYELGRGAVEMLLSRVEGDPDAPAKEVRLSCELLERGSVSRIDPEEAPP